MSSVVNMQFAEVDYGETLAEEGLFSFGKGDILWLIELGVLLIGFLAVTFFGLRPLIKYITAEGEGGPLRYVLEGGETCYSCRLDRHPNNRPPLPRRSLRARWSRPEKVLRLLFRWMKPARNLRPPKLLKPGY